jgi:hypothetical protein
MSGGAFSLRAGLVEFERGALIIVGLFTRSPTIRFIIMIVAIV